MPTLRPASAADAATLAALYGHYALNTIITFEVEPPSPEEMARRIQEVQDLGLPWLVLEEQGQLLGYAYAARWKARWAYRFSAETTVYLAPGQERRAYGRLLMEALLRELRLRGMHTALAGIALPNPGSVGLHEALGFVPVAAYKELGWKFGRWIDVGYWQLMLANAQPLPPSGPEHSPTKAP